MSQAPSGKLTPGIRSFPARLHRLSAYATKPGLIVRALNFPRLLGFSSVLRRCSDRGFRRARAADGAAGYWRRHPEAVLRR